MAIKHVCDICKDDKGVLSIWVWDGGTQIDPPSGRTEETGSNVDICSKCYLELFKKTFREIVDIAYPVFSKIATNAIVKRWNGK